MNQIELNNFDCATQLFCCQFIFLVFLFFKMMKFNSKDFAKKWRLLRKWKLFAKLENCLKMQNHIFNMQKTDKSTHKLKNHWNEHLFTRTQSERIFHSSRGWDRSLMKVFHQRFGRKCAFRGELLSFDDDDDKLLVLSANAKWANS